MQAWTPSTGHSCLTFSLAISRNDSRGRRAPREGGREKWWSEAESGTAKGASSACISAPIVPSLARTRAARRATAVSYHISSAQCGKPRRRKTEEEREREGGRGERKDRGEEEKRKRERLERGRVAFNQSLASKCTVHVYVYKEEGGRKGEVEESGIWFG